MRGLLLFILLTACSSQSSLERLNLELAAQSSMDERPVYIRVKGQQELGVDESRELYYVCLEELRSSLSLSDDELRLCLSFVDEHGVAVSSPYVTHVTRQEDHLLFRKTDPETLQAIEFSREPFTASSTLSN